MIFSYGLSCLFSHALSSQNDKINKYFAMLDYANRSYSLLGHKELFRLWAVNSGSYNACFIFPKSFCYVDILLRITKNVTF